MESGKEQNYWPGFVDALSNVVLTLVFVLVVFVFALVLASNKVNQKAQELTEAAQKKAAEQIQNNKEVVHLHQSLQSVLDQLEIVQQDNNKLRNEIVKLKRQQAAVVPPAPPPEPKVVPTEDPEKVPPVAEERNALIERVQIAVDKAPERPVDPKRDDNPLVGEGTGAIIVVFPRGVFDVSEQARAELAKTLGPQKGRLSGMMVSIKSVMGVESYSEAQRLAYYRGLNVRNYLIENGFGTGQTIKVVVEQAKEVGDGRVEIRFGSR